MPLYIVPTPLGHFDDITVRAKTILAQCDFVIAEEHRPTSTLLKKLNIKQKEIFILNEHTKDKDLVELENICRLHNVALVSDCGTPNFCDPGFQIISRCRDKNIMIQALPGPSSLATLLSLSRIQIKQFQFEGFLPSESEKRTKKIQFLQKISQPIVILETPYRLNKLIQELSLFMPQRKALLALDLTLPTEKVLEGPLQKISSQIEEKTKQEPILLIYSKDCI